MNSLWKMTSFAVGLGVIALSGGYLVDNQRCKNLNYEEIGYEVPSTWIVSTKQCLDMADNIRLRSYARSTSPAQNR